MKFDAKAFERTRGFRAANWAVLDEELYRLCRRHPSHEDRGVVNAKLAIIGRTYGTGIERKMPSNGSPGSSLSAIGVLIHDARKAFDAEIAALRTLRGSPTPQKLATVIASHGRLVAVMQKRLHGGQRPHSFVSKYLHFHCPLVPVYDTVASRVLRGLGRWQASWYWDLPEVRRADPVYAEYVMRFWQLYLKARDSGVKPSVKALDYFLLSGAT